MKKLLLALLLGVGLFNVLANYPANYPANVPANFFANFFGDNPEPLPAPAAPGPGADQILQQAFAARRSNIQVEGSGTVTALLRDDTKGSRHQKFILELSSGQTLLVAHNIDLAPRLDNLQRGDTVAFCGEYEWNAKGGVLHWTHRDPAGRHPGGWLRHRGQFYQ
jgi:hypothetical protein